MIADMSREHRAYMRGEILASAAINALLGLGFAFLISRGADRVALWTNEGFAIGFVAQTFVITFVMALSVTLLARQRIGGGRLQPLSQARTALSGRLPRNAVLRASLLSVVATLWLAVGGLFAFRMLGVATMDLGAFIAFEVLYGTVLALCLTPSILRAALVAQTPSAPQG
jgi:hypothetical protein